MRYISSDTNIWIDFNVIDRVEFPFRLPYAYIMYEEALRREVIAPAELLQELTRRGLGGVELTIEEFDCAQELTSRYVKLSGYDRIALAIAKMRNISLLTGDNALRKAAEKEGVHVFGTIGLLKKLYEGTYITLSEYRYCLENLLRHPERRLPADELKRILGSLP